MRSYVIRAGGSSLDDLVVVEGDEPKPGPCDVLIRVRAHCAARLAKFKVPASVVIAADIPRTASGKVLKHVLRDRALSEMGETDA